IRELREAVAALAFDQALHAALEAAVEPGLRGRSLEREAMALVAEADTAAGTAATATKEEATARAALAKAQARADVAASRPEAARAATMLAARAQEVATALAAAIDALCQVVPEVAALAPPQSPAVSPWPGFAILDDRRAQVRAAKVRRDQHDADLRTAEQG